MSAKAPIAPEFDSEHPADPAEEHDAPDEGPRTERVDLDRYVVVTDAPIGYVEWVAPVFVCYAGHPYRNSEEIAQTHGFDEAVKRVLDRASRNRAL